MVQEGVLLQESGAAQPQQPRNNAGHFPCLHQMRAISLALQSLKTPCSPMSLVSSTSESHVASCPVPEALDSTKYPCDPSGLLGIWAYCCPQAGSKKSMIPIPSGRDRIPIPRAFIGLHSFCYPLFKHLFICSFSQVSRAFCIVCWTL